MNHTMHPAPSPGQTLRVLFWPVYAPSFIYAAGMSALLPAQVLLALALGFTSAQVALITTAVGAFSIAASFASGYIVQALGEHRALWLTSLAGMAMLLVTAVLAETDPAAARWVLVPALVVFDLTDAVWSIARQGLVADLAPAAHRGQAMNAYGAAQRLGRVVGPFVAAAVLAAGPPSGVLPATAALVGVALLVMSHFLRRMPDRDVAEPSHEPEITRPAMKRALRGLVLLGIGVLVLTALRMTKETLLPLWGADGLHLPEAQVAFIVGIASTMELLLFWPAGLALDRIGRAPVIVACLVTMSAGLLAMPWSHALVWFVLTSMLVGLGDGIGAGIVKTMGVDIAPAHARGRFLGWWQSVASVGSLLAPSLAAVIIAAAGLAAVLPVMGAIGLAGAGWMAYWTPRLIPRPARR